LFKNNNLHPKLKVLDEGNVPSFVRPFSLADRMFYSRFADTFTGYVDDQINTII
jgi:hypothetical protein